MAEAHIRAICRDLRAGSLFQNNRRNCKGERVERSTSTNRMLAMYRQWWLAAFEAELARRGLPPSI